MSKLSKDVSLAHDVRNTLAPALLIIERLELSACETSKSTLQKLYRAIDRTVLLCENRMRQEHSIVHDLTSFHNIFDIVNSAAETAVNTSPKIIELSIEISASLRFPVNKDVLYCSVLNLMHNAVKAVSINGGKIAVQARVDCQHFLRIDIYDNGFGMAKVIKESIETYLASPNKGMDTTRFGIRSTVEALRDIEGSLELVKSDLKGTHFAIIIPKHSSEPICLPANEGIEFDYLIEKKCMS